MVTVFLAAAPALAAGFALGRLSAPKVVGARHAVPLHPVLGSTTLTGQRGEVTRVVDGDTIRVLYRGTDESVRLLRIDTPERGQPGFEEATAALRRLVGGREVVLEFETPGVEERDRYGRLLAYVFPVVGDTAAVARLSTGRLGGTDSMNVNVEMVRLGHSRFWTEYGRGRYACDFEAAEREAPPPAGKRHGGARAP